MSDSQDHLFTFNSHFLELLQDPTLADEGRYFLIDATLGKVIEVKFDFINIFFRRFSRSLSESDKDGSRDEDPEEITLFDIIEEMTADLSKLTMEYHVPLEITVQNLLRFIKIIMNVYPKMGLMSPFQENIISFWQYDSITEQWDSFETQMTTKKNGKRIVGSARHRGWHARSWHRGYYVMFMVKHKYIMHHSQHMSSKTITIRKEVYEELRRIKGQDESFSDLLLRLARNSNGKKLERFFGAWDIDDVEWGKIEKELDVARRRVGQVRVDLE